ncbi:hypothetical protein [Nocardia sp. XZ_19_369]|uniref:hypothetical protein n=1 Tax=Nocardia sp. XZ_19_369 TaxID=2769487 RepID=UPI00188F137A|nr:hypothetical protein [Nocardia sp. XZ_19_369]
MDLPAMNLAAHVPAHAPTTATMEPTPATIDGIARVMMIQIRTDFTVGRLPETVASFTELHAYVDANDYAARSVERYSRETGRDWLDFVNEVTDIVDTWLRAGHPADIDLSTRRTASCWHESTLIHLGPHHETLPLCVQHDHSIAITQLATAPAMLPISPAGDHTSGPIPHLMY